jgi:hypothetical protein
MDLDAISANVGFTYALFKAECLDAGICARCGGNYDSVHQDQGGCPIQVENQLTLGNKLMMWKDWGGYVRPRRSGQQPAQNPHTAPTAPAASTVTKGKKRESIAESGNDPSPKRRESEPEVGGIASGSGSHDMSSMVMEPMHLGGLLFERQIAGAEYEDCEQDCHVKRFPSSSNNRPIFQGFIAGAGQEKLPCRVLIDSGATSLFVNKLYAYRNKFCFKLLTHKI